MACYHRFRGQSAPERMAARQLEEACFRFVAQMQFGRYTVDFYLPDHRIALEIDGEYWHGKAGKPERKVRSREEFLTDVCKLTVIHMPAQYAKAGMVVQLLRPYVVPEFSDFITPVQLGRAEELAQEGFK